MKLHSVYLNPFQPFPEREIEKPDDESPRTAIEDNLSRAVFSALANADGPYALAMFLQDLAPCGSPELCAHTETMANSSGISSCGKCIAKFPARAAQSPTHAWSDSTLDSTRHPFRSPTQPASYISDRSRPAHSPATQFRISDMSSFQSSEHRLQVILLLLLTETKTMVT